MSKTARLLVIAVAFIIALALLAPPRSVEAERQPLPELHIGSAAPPLKVMKWVKGTPVDGLQPGQTYVIEFWATWCGPCIAAMPHITGIAKTYDGRVTVVGVDVSEHVPTRTEADLVAVIEPFVAAQGDRMDYNVAIDGPAEEMRLNWLEAASRDGIPCTFIIDKDKKVAWIGHPMAMDEVLPKVIDGTWDIRAAAEEQARQWEHDQDLKEAVAPVIAALRRHNFPEVVVAIDAAVAKVPEVETELRPVRFEALLLSDEAAAFAYLKDSVQSKLFEKEPIDAFNFFDAVNRNASKLINPDWATVTSALEQAHGAVKDESPPLLVAIASVYAKQLKFDKAAELQKQAIDAAGKADPAPPARWVELQQKTLAGYQARL